MYDYMEAMKSDIQDWMEENEELVNEYKYSRDELEQKMNDDLWIEDSVTGNGSGFYSYSIDSMNCVMDNGMEYLRSAINDFGISAEEITEKFINEEWDYFDITVRCYLLSAAISEVLDDLESEDFFEEEEEEEA